jgi:DNA-binding NtrC family response regulator
MQNDDSGSRAVRRAAAARTAGACLRRPKYDTLGAPHQDYLRPVKKDLLPAARESAKHILVVDDTIDSRLSLSSLLRVVGYIVYEASDAAQALRLLESSLPIDALVTDVEMPGALNGLALAQYVRAAHPDIAVAIASGGDYASQVTDPAVLFLRKPYKSERLLDYLERACS